MPFSFNATGDAFTIPIPARGFPLTLSCFANRTSANAMALMSVGALTNRFQLTHVSSAFNSTSQISGGTSSATVSATFSANQWYHCLGTLTADNSRASFLDANTATNSASRVLGTSLNEIAIGARRDAGNLGAWWGGQIAMVGVWGAVLSPDEIRALRLGFAPSRVRLTDLLAEIPLVKDVYETLGKIITTVGGPTLTETPPRLYP